MEAAMKEREVKLSAGREFELPPLAWDGVVATPRGDEHLSTLYLDSAELHLARWGVSFRHREGQGWTVKLPSADAGALLVRDECVFPGERGTPPAQAVDLVRGYLRHAELVPQMQLRTIRRGVQLHDAEGRMVADVVDDAVSVLRDEQVVEGFRELEVETTEDTPPGLLEAIVEQLRDAGAGALDPTPKYLRALGGPEAAVPEVVPGELARDASVGAVVRHAIAAGVVRLVHHDPVVRLDSDPEGVHQARVATRRLRSDLRTFRAVLDPEWSRALREELGWLGGELGAARDADVLLDRLQGRARTLPPPSARGVAQVVAALEKRRVQAHVELLEALHSDRYLDLLDRLVAAAQAPALLDAEAERPAREALPPVVRRSWRALKRTEKALGDPPSDEALHAVRISAKRCRYAAEACAPPLGKKTRKLAVAAAALQDVLGELNDAVVAERWLRQWASASRRPTGAFAAGELATLERLAVRRARSQWPAAWKLVAARAPR
jgi:CHAD domain-containing protein